MTTIVTGASSGIGHALTERLLTRREEVIGMARHAESIPDGSVRLSVDLAAPGAATRALAAASAYPVNALVHCAGYGDFAPVELTTHGEAARQLQVNLLAAAELVEAVLPGMRDAGAGRIVLVSSIASQFSSPMGGWYHASKAALEAWAGSLRQEVGGMGIDVALIQPGVVRTQWHNTALDSLVTRTAGTPYEQAGRATAAYHQRSAASRMACEADDVVDAIEHALTETRPRTHYLVGRGSRTAMTLPKIVGARTFDAMTLKQFGITPPARAPRDAAA